MKGKLEDASDESWILALDINGEFDDSIGSRKGTANIVDAVSNSESDSLKTVTSIISGFKKNSKDNQQTPMTKTFQILYEREGEHQKSNMSLLCKRVHSSSEDDNYNEDDTGMANNENDKNQENNSGKSFFLKRHLFD